jgi:hypothetical protein
VSGSMNNHTMPYMFVERSDDGAKSCHEFHRMVAHEGNDAKITEDDYSMAYNEDDVILFDKLYQFFAPKEDDEPCAFNAVEQHNVGYLGGIDYTSIMHDIWNISGQNHAIVKESDRIHVNTTKKVGASTEAANVLAVESQAIGTEIEQDQMIRIFHVKKDDFSLVDKNAKSFWHDIEEYDLLSSFSFYQWENYAAENNDEVIQNLNFRILDDQSCSSLMSNESIGHQPESANSLEVNTTSAGLKGKRNEIMWSALHDLDFQGQNALSSFPDVDHKKSDLIRMVSSDELSNQVNTVLESLENLPEKSKQGDIVLEMLNLDNIAPIDIEEEKSTQSIRNSECCDTLTNLGLEAYLKSVDLMTKTAPRKAKAEKLDDPLTPIRPLSAYNYFFRDERERILHDRKGKQSQDRSLLYTKERQARSLNAHWNQDRTKRRRHRKTHGQVSFTQLSKLKYTTCIFTSGHNLVGES